MTDSSQSRKKRASLKNVDAQTAIFIFKTIIKAANGLIVEDDKEECEEIQKRYGYFDEVEFSLSVATEEDEVKILKVDTHYYLTYKGYTMDISTSPVEFKDPSPFLAADPFRSACTWVKNLASNQLSMVITQTPRWELLIATGGNDFPHYEFKSLTSTFIHPSSVTLEEIIQPTSLNQIASVFLQPKLMTEDSASFTAGEVAYTVIGHLFEELSHTIIDEHLNRENIQEDKLMDLLNEDGDFSWEDTFPLDFPNSEDKGDLSDLLDRIEKRSRNKKNDEDENK